MTKILSPLIIEDIDGRHVRIVKPFIVESDVLRKHGYYPQFIVPVDFVCDLESTPLLKGTSPRGGVGHDYLSRSDSGPVVTKAIAAEVYREIMAHVYSLRAKNRMSRSWGWIKQWIKWSVVRVAPGYFHKFQVMATYEEIAG
jgi:hypothetical protein